MKLNLPFNTIEKSFHSYVKTLYKLQEKNVYKEIDVLNIDSMWGFPRNRGHILKLDSQVLIITNWFHSDGFVSALSNNSKDIH